MPDRDLHRARGAPGHVHAGHVRGGRAVPVAARRRGPDPTSCSAGLGLGLAFGTKWYAVPAVAVVVVVWGRHGCWRDGPPAAPRRDGRGLVGIVGCVGGFWLLRNLVESGNPFFPVKVSPFGVTLFDAPPDIERSSTGSRSPTTCSTAGSGTTISCRRSSASSTLSAVVLAVGLASALAGPSRSGRRHRAWSRPDRGTDARGLLRR